MSNRKNISTTFPRVAIATLGCKVNQYESASFQNSLEALGVDMVPFAQEADVYIINTCAVTARAGAQSRQLIRRAVRMNPGARIVVTGCYAQVASQDILELAEQPVCIVGNGYKHKLVDIALASQYCDLEMHMGDISRPREICDLPVTRFGDRTRAYLKIQDGCDRFCSYCIVPYARGRSRSLAPGKVLEQARVFADQGYREVVITGIHTGTYGQDLAPQNDLLTMLRELLALNLPQRYRLSSLEPTEVSAELLELIAGSASLTPHLHIPLQSGDDHILTKMHRRYNAAFFEEVITACCQRLPGVAIGIDVMVGFPGENDVAFGNTVALLERLPVAYLHVFPYSRRPGTVAAGMAGQLPGPVKAERVRVLRELDQQKRRVFYRQQIGGVRQVLVEGGKKRPRLLQGFTENYVPVCFAGGEELVNTVVNVRIDREQDGKVYGNLADAER